MHNNNSNGNSASGNEHRITNVLARLTVPNPSHHHPISYNIQHHEPKDHMQSSLNRLNFLARKMQIPVNLQSCLDELITWCSDPRAFHSNYIEALLLCCMTAEEMSMNVGSLQSSLKFISICYQHCDEFGDLKNSLLNVYNKVRMKVRNQQSVTANNISGTANYQQQTDFRPPSNSSISQLHQGQRPPQAMRSRLVSPQMMNDGNNQGHGRTNGPNNQMLNQQQQQMNQHAVTVITLLGSQQDPYTDRTREQTTDPQQVRPPHQYSLPLGTSSSGTHFNRQQHSNVKHEPNTQPNSNGPTLLVATAIELNTEVAATTVQLIEKQPPQQQQQFYTNTQNRCMQQHQNQHPPKQSTTPLIKTPAPAGDPSRFTPNRYQTIPPATPCDVMKTKNHNDQQLPILQPHMFTRSPGIQQQPQQQCRTGYNEPPMNQYNSSTVGFYNGNPTPPPCMPTPCGVVGPMNGQPPFQPCTPVHVQQPRPMSQVGMPPSMQHGRNVVHTNAPQQPHCGPMMQAGPPLMAHSKSLNHNEPINQHNGPLIHTNGPSMTRMGCYNTPDMKPIIQHQNEEPRISFLDQPRNSYVLNPFKLEHHDKLNKLSRHNFTIQKKVFDTIHQKNDMDIQLKCYHQEDTNRQTQWPDSVEVSINSRPIYIDRKGLHRALYLKKFCQVGKNSIDISVSSCCCNHLFVVQFVRRPTIRETIQGLVQKRVLPYKIAAQRLKRYMTSNGKINRFSFIRDEKVILMSLICLSSGERIRLPARSNNCIHLQCFDLEYFLLRNQDCEVWFCPICQQPADRESLEVDQFVHNILSSTNTSIHQHVSVTLSGAFQPITAEHFNSRAPLSGGNSLNPHQLPPNRFLPNIKQEMPLIKYSQVKQEPGVSNNYIKLQHPSSNKTKVRGVTSQQDNGAPPNKRGRQQKQTNKQTKNKQKKQTKTQQQKQPATIVTPSTTPLSSMTSSLSPMTSSLSSVTSSLSSLTSPMTSSLVQASESSTVMTPQSVPPPNQNISHQPTSRDDVTAFDEVLQKDADDVIDYVDNFISSPNPYSMFDEPRDWFDQIAMPETTERTINKPTTPTSKEAEEQDAETEILRLFDIS